MNLSVISISVSLRNLMYSGSPYKTFENAADSYYVNNYDLTVLIFKA